MEISRAESFLYKKGYRIIENGLIVNPEGVVINGHKRKDGYIKISYRDVNNKTKKCMVHRLVAYQKFGEKMYANGILVRHLDGNPSNNSYSNIEIGTQSDNMMDKPESVRMAAAMKATSFLRKYDRNLVVSFYIANGKSYKKTMEKFGITSKGTLNFILRGG